MNRLRVVIYFWNLSFVIWKLQLMYIINEIISMKFITCFNELNHKKMQEIQTEIAFKGKAKQKTTSSTSSSSIPFKSEKCLICNWRISHLEPQQFTILSVDLFHPQLVLIHSTELEYLWESFFQFNYSSRSNIIQTANEHNTENFFIHSSIFYFLK